MGDRYADVKGDAKMVAIANYGNTGQGYRVISKRQVSGLKVKYGPIYTKGGLVK